MHDAGSLCISTMWLFAFFLAKRWQEMQGKEISGKGTKRNFIILPSSTTRLSCMSSSSLLFPFLLIPLSHNSPSSPHPPPFLIILLLLLIKLLLFSSFRKFGRPPGSPSLPSRTCMTYTAISAYMSGLLLPPGSKIMIGSRFFRGYEIITGLTRH